MRINQIVESRDLCHVCGQTPCNCTHITESTGNIGAQIRAVYKKIYDAGDDAVEFVYYDSPIFAQYWDEYEGDLDSIIAEVDPSELEIILGELESAAEDQGVAEGSEEGNLYAIAIQRYPQLKQVDRETVINALNNAYEDYLMHYGYEGIGPDEESSMIDHAVKGLKQGMAEGHADQQRKIFKKNGHPVGEVGIDRESSPGVGQWYMKYYPTGDDFSGYDSMEEAVAELKHLVSQFKSAGSLNEFAAGGGGGSGNYFQALASAWYNGAFNTGSLQKGIKSKEDVERLLNRGIVAPDGVTRKYAIDYNSDFDGVVISSDDYYEHSDYGDAGGEVDSRTGQPWGPYDYMEFKDEELDEGVAEGLQPDSDIAVLGVSILNALKEKCEEIDRDHPEMWETFTSDDWIQSGKSLQFLYDYIKTDKMNIDAFTDAWEDLNTDPLQYWPTEWHNGQWDSFIAPWREYAFEVLKSRGVDPKPPGPVHEGVAEGDKKPEPPEADYGADYQDMVSRVKKLAGLGPLKTVYDPQKRVYRNVPTAVQPKK